MTFLIRIRSLVFFAIIVSFFAYNNINVVVRRRINAKVMELNGKTHSEAVTEVRDIEGLQEGLKFRQLPNSDLHVSEICLGTMNFGDQLSEKESFDILDAACNKYGINFIDTAEIYPSPSSPRTSGLSERIIGKWLQSQVRAGKKRSDVIISTKICGYSDQITWCRRDGSATRVTRDQVMEAVDLQLKRLGTDYIDLLQIHWPERYVQMYGAPEYLYDLERPAISSIKEQLEIMSELVKSGKIRYFGVSNETPYGVAVWNAMAEFHGLIKPITIQNGYNLLHRNEFESGLIEATSPYNANLGLLAYSPLAGGALTGKYLQHIGDVSPQSRLRQYVGFMHRYLAPPVMDAVRAYEGVAKEFSLPLTAIALSFVYSRPFVSSTIIGVTSLEQLRQNVLALNVPMVPAIAEAINAIYRKHVDPAKGEFEVVDPNIEIIDPAKLPWGAKESDVDPDLDILINQRISRF